MKRGERGFTLIEVLVVIAIAALITTAATMSTFQAFNVTRRSNDHMATVRQVQNAGYWISRDALIAQNIVVGDDPETEEELEFLTLTWTEWDYDWREDSEYHSVTYSFPFQYLSSDGVGKLIRTHSSDGPDEQTLVAEYIYYDSEDPENHTDTEATYKAPVEAPEQAPVLTVQITSFLGEASETREYQVLPRPDF